MFAQYIPTLQDGAAHVADMTVLTAHYIWEMINEAGLEAAIVGGVCIFFLFMSERQATKSKLESKTKVVSGKSSARGISKTADSFKRASNKYSAGKAATNQLRDKLEVPTARAGRTFWQAVQGLERYKAVVWEQGSDLTDCFSASHARAFFVNLLTCVAQAGPESLPVAPGASKEAGAAEWIKRLLSDMRKFGFPRDVEVYVTMMKVFANEQSWKEVLSFHKEMTTDGIEPDSSLLIGFMTAAVHIDDTAAALQHFRAHARLEAPSQRTYMTVLRVYTKTKDWEGAMKLCEEMESLGSPPDSLVLNQVLGLCVAQGQMAAAEKLFNHWQGVIDVISCNTVLKAFAREGALTESEAMLNRMLSKGPAPNLITFNTIMECSFRVLQHLDNNARGASGSGKGSGKHDSSKAQLAQLRVISNRPWELLNQLMEYGLEPDRFTCSILVKGMHVAGGSADEIDRTIALLKRLGPAAFQITNTRLVEVLFNTLLDVCSSFQDLDRMVAIFGLMQQFECGICAVTFGTLIKAFGQAGKISRCHDVWQQMRNASTAPSVVTYGCYIDACIRNKELCRAERIFHSMRDDHLKPNVVIYTSLIRGLASAGEPARAFALYRQMRAAGVEPTSVTFNSVLDMVARQLADPENLQEVIKDLQSVTSRPDATAYCILITASCESGNLDNAVSLWRQLRYQGITFDQGTFNTIMLACVKTNRMSDIEEMFHDMRQVGMVPNNSVAANIFKMFGRLQLPNRAIEMFDLMEMSKGDRPNLQVYSCLIQACMTSKVWKRAYEIFERMLRHGIEPDAAVYDKVISSCIHLNKYGHAIGLVRHAAMLPMTGSPRPWESPRSALDGLPLTRKVSLQPETAQNLLSVLKSKEQYAFVEELSNVMKQL